MEKIKTIIFYLGILLSGIMSFLGLMYVNKGELVLSAVFAAIIVLIQYFVILKFRDNKDIVSKNKISAITVVLFILYLVAIIPSTIFTLHSLNVQLFHKSEVIKNSNAHVEKIDFLTKQYENKYDAYLNLISANLENNLKKYEYETLLKSKKNKNNKTKIKRLEEVLTSSPYLLKSEQLQNFVNGNVSSTSIVKKVVDNRKEAFEKNAKESLDEKLVEKHKKNINNWNLLSVSSSISDLSNLHKSAQEKYNSSLIKNILLPKNIAEAKEFSSIKESPSEISNLLTNPIKLIKEHIVFGIVIGLLFNFLLIIPVIKMSQGGYKSRLKTYPGGRILTRRK